MYSLSDNAVIHVCTIKFLESYKHECLEGTCRKGLILPDWAFFWSPRVREGLEAQDTPPPPPLASMISLLFCKELQHNLSGLVIGW